MIENYFELLKSCSAQPFSAEMTVLVCEPIIHAVAYCENKAFFKQSSEALIQGLLPDADEGDEEDGEGESEEDEESEEELEEEENSGLENENEIGSDIESSGEEFDSEDFDNIEDDSHGSHCSHGSECCNNHDDEEVQEMIEEEPLIFDYSLLSKFIFDFGAREDVLIRNRRFLYELSQIIEEIPIESCCGESESCCGESNGSCRN